VHEFHDGEGALVCLQMSSRGSCLFTCCTLSLYLRGLALMHYAVLRMTAHDHAVSLTLFLTRVEGKVTLWYSGHVCSLIISSPACRVSAWIVCFG